MLFYTTQTFNYIVKTLANLDDSKDPFEAGDLVEVREEIEYVETPKLTTQKRPRAKAISSGKYAKNKGEKEKAYYSKIQ